jgi:diguanylate cyclase (GGDEF)-like protein
VSGIVFAAALTWAAVAFAVVAGIAGAVLLFGLDNRVLEETHRGRFLSELMSSLELKSVMHQTLDAAIEMTAADAALISLDDGQGSWLTESIGMSEEEEAEYKLERPPHAGVGSTTASYEGVAAAFGEEPPITDSVTVPIHGQRDETVGVLSIFSRGDQTVLSESRVRKLEDLAALAAPMIQNGRRFREVTDIDLLTPLYSKRYFETALEREFARAQRYNLRLGLLVFDLDGFKAINDRIGHTAGDEVLVDFAERVHGVVRSADIACRVGGDEFTVILPGSGLEAAEHLYHRLSVALAVEPIVHVGRARISAGVAELRREDDARSFFNRADHALLRVKDWGKGRLAWASGDRAEPPPEADYRPGTDASRCSACEHFRSGQQDVGYCERWHAPVEAKHVCDEFMPMRSGPGIGSGRQSALNVA